MSALPKVQTEETLLQDEAKWELVLRVASSSHFHKSARHRDFLLYVCEKCIKGQQHELREQQIGVRVFERPPDYNPSEDNIVRVQARELRKRLESYFVSEGKDEPTIITIPKGAYVPVFEPRNLWIPEPSTQSESNEIAPRKLSTAQPLTPIYPLKGKPRILVPVLVGLVLLLLTASLWLWRENQAQRYVLQQHSWPNKLELAPSPSGVWPLLFDSAAETLIVASDIPFVLLQKFTNIEIPLQDYVSRKYLANLKTDELQFIASRQWTTVADLKIVRQIIGLDQGYLEKTRILYPLNLRLQDLKTQNIILLGSRRSNPWVELFENQRNFYFEYDKAVKKSFYRNKSPRAGEETVYRTGGDDNNSDEAYGVVTFLPNLSQTGHILIIEGTTSEGFEAAGAFVTDPKLFSTFEQKVKSGNKDAALPYFELLLKTHRLEGTFKEPIYVTHRILSKS